MFNSDTHGPWTVVHAGGEIDVATADEFRQTLLDALQRGEMVAIDFTEVTFMDSSGISVIVAGLKCTRYQGGSLVLVGLSERVRVPLDLTGVSEIVDIRPSVAYLDVGRAAS
jgi:anti-sigma B factor antagonist